MTEKRAAVMQPYIFPYIGYFHLIHASSAFVFYDDVQYIKGGWINRNKIINRDKELLFSVPVNKASSNKLINETRPSFDEKWKNAFHKSLVQNYKKAPYFDETIDVIMAPFAREYDDITDLAIESIVAVYNFLEVPFDYTKSSIFTPETKGMAPADRLIEITRKFGLNAYVNVPGGKSLYDKEYFRSKGIELSFVKSHSIEYKQFHDTFVPWLSIIDVLMFCSKNQTVDFMACYSLE